MTRLILGLMIAVWASVAGVSAQSSNPYGIAVRVNDRVITNFEIDQRVLLLRAFGTTGDLRKTATDQLIEIACAWMQPNRLD